MYDVAIVGAGPAGATAARLLAEAGAKVVVLDGSHPREKPCGGGVTGRAMTLVAEALRLQSLPAVRIAAARFVDSSGVRGAPGEALADCRVALPSDAGLLVTDRRHFDGCLLDLAREAGATFVPRRVTGLDRAATAFRVRTASGAEDARMLVGADGANSLARRLLAAPLGRPNLSIATGFYAHGVTSDEIVIELVDDPPGYLWSFPRPDHLAIGICAQADGPSGSAALRERALRWIRDTRLAADARLEAYSWPIPSLSASGLADATLDGPGWLLVGDAAGLVDPITREGIFFALQSARLAARALLSDRPASYAESVRREILPELCRAAQLKHGFFRASFRRLVMEALGQSVAVRSVMADLIAGTQPYRGLRWRLARTFEVGLAVKLLTAKARDTLRGPEPAPLAD